MYAKMKRMFLCFAVTVSAVFIFSGCVNWYELPVDSLEAPQQMIQKEIDTYNQRLKFRKKAYFVPLKTTRNVFWHSWFRTYVGKISYVDVFTQQLGAQLQSKFGVLKDLELIGLHSDVIDEATFGTEQGMLLDQKLPQAADLLITYKVTNVAVRESVWSQLARYTTAIVGWALALGGEGRSGAIVADSGEIVRLYYAAVSAKVDLVDTKSGRQIFTYNIHAESIPAPVCTGREIENCIQKLAEKACANYLCQFGPPIYTTESRGYGKMVQLNVGKDYGVVPGMKFRFITKNEQGHEYQIGTGYVRDWFAPAEDLGQDYTRVIVNGQGKPENFRVMKNMIAKPIPMQ